MKKLILAFYLLLPLTANAQSLMLDSQTITWMKDLSTPLLKAAKIDKEDVNFYLLKDNEINAFVTNNRDVFMHSGLILKAEKAEEVLGVLAHEIGHIQGRHTEKYLKNQGKFVIPTLLGTILGVGAAALGSPDAAVALVIGGQAASQSNQIAFTRIQEREADNHAFQLLNSTGQSAQGLYSFFEKLRGHQLLYSEVPPSYLMTHPLPAERMDHVKFNLSKESINLKEPLNNDEFELIQAKLFAFSNRPNTTLRKYRESTSNHLFAQAIALALQAKTKESLVLVNKLLSTNNSPHIHELKAQILLDIPDLDGAAEHFKKALEMRDDLPIIRLQYGDLLSTQGKNKEAIQNLLRAAEELSTWPNVHRSLGIAYGRDNQLALSHLSLFNEAHLKKDTKQARNHFDMAEKYIENSTPQAKRKLKIAKEKLKTMTED